MTCFEFRWNLGISLSSECRNAIPLATSRANSTAREASNTKPVEDSSCRT